MTPKSLKGAMDVLQSGRRELREMLEHAKSDEEKEDLKAQLAALSRQTARMRMLYVHEIGVPVLIVLVFVLLAVYLIQRS